VSRRPLAAWLAALACAACHRDARPDVANGAIATDAAVAAAETVVHVGDDGKTFDLARGATLVFELATEGGTGFAWVPVPLDGGSLVQQGDRTTERSSDAPGAPRKDVYRFVGEQPGTTIVEIQLKRPWTDTPPAKTLRVTVNVH
jgi:predicted secreted protein